MFSFCDFFDCAIEGESMNEDDKPMVLGNGNIAWPPGWTEKMAKEYRQRHGLLAPSDQVH